MFCFNPFGSVYGMFLPFTPSTLLRACFLLLTFFAYPLYAIRYTLLTILPKNRLEATKIPVFKRKMSMT
jgi:hypothetical protein